MTELSYMRVKDLQALRDCSDSSARREYKRLAQFFQKRKITFREFCQREKVDFIELRDKFLNV